MRKFKCKSKVKIKPQKELIKTKTYIRGQLITMKLRLVIVLALAIFSKGLSQVKPQQNSAEIFHAIKKLNFLGSVLYIAAHPDDENTRLIAHLSNHTHARTAYLSLTRGDGGQNLIGPELRAELGVIRTNELLKARSYDGGLQFFSRANDFGYSKHPDETFEIWNKEEVLKDVVSTIRGFQPDIIINRFDHRSPGRTHGHHTGSAMLSFEAFDLANDVTFKSHLTSQSPWQPKKLYFNTSWWFYGSRDNFEKADKTNLISLEVGNYYKLLGASNTEIAANSRSQHKSQGFGTMSSRGEYKEYLEIIKTDKNYSHNNLFDGIDTSWNRLEGGKQIGDILHDVENTFDFNHPENAVPKLIEAYNLISQLKDGYWKQVKIEEIKSIILQCTGLYIDIYSTENIAIRGDQIPLNIEVIARNKTPLTLKEITLANQKTVTINRKLVTNQNLNFNDTFKVPEKAVFSSPYWLNDKARTGMYHVEDKNLIGKPYNKSFLEASCTFLFEKTPLTFEVPIIHKSKDPIKGEVKEAINVMPEITCALQDDVLILKNKNSKTVTVTVRNFGSQSKGTVELKTPSGWIISPQKIDFKAKSKGETLTFEFKITAPDFETNGSIHPVVTLDSGKTYNQKLTIIDYSHIPKQYILSSNSAKLISMNIKSSQETIGYIEGAGDKTAEVLKTLGFNVITLKEEDLTLKKLSTLNSIITGVRAYNTQDFLAYKQDVLNDYVKNGGTIINQYNTSFNLKTKAISPYALNLSRKRVTNEGAEVKINNPKHRVFNYPNTINNADFENWVQERGLYFPDSWGPEFEAVLTMNDKGETPLQGGLLIAQHGKGHYIYTGLSFFRQLPAGVPGAIKLFTNMLSVSDLNKTIEN